MVSLAGERIERPADVARLPGAVLCDGIRGVDTSGDDAGGGSGTAGTLTAPASSEYAEASDSDEAEGPSAGTCRGSAGESVGAGGDMCGETVGDAGTPDA